MALSADQELIIRTWVGDDFEASYLEDLYAALGNWDDVVRAAIRRKIAILSEDPTSISVPGLSISNGQQVVALQDLLDRFDAEGGTGLEDAVAGMTVAKLVRADNIR